jgi:hypothetical protein
MAENKSRREFLNNLSPMVFGGLVGNAVGKETGRKEQFGNKEGAKKLAEIARQVITEANADEFVENLDPQIAKLLASKLSSRETE